MKRYLTLAAAALALTAATAAPAAAEEPTAEPTTVNEPIELRLGDEYFSLDLNDNDADADDEVFNSSLSGPGAGEKRPMVIRNEGTISHDLKLWAANGKVVGDPLWAEQTTLSAQLLNPLNSEAKESAHSFSVAALDPAMYDKMPVVPDPEPVTGPEGVLLYAVTLAPKTETTIDLSYLVPEYYDENDKALGGTGGNSAECARWSVDKSLPCEQSEGASVTNPAADDTGFTFDLLVTSQHLTADTGAGPGWNHRLDEPYAWTLTAVGALLAAAFISFRSTLRSSIRSSAPKETTP